MRRHLLLVASALLLVLCAWPPSSVSATQTVAVEITADRTRITVGDRIVLTVTMRLPTDAQPDITGLEQQFGEDIDVLVIGLPEERPLSAGQKEVRLRYEVTVFRPGAAQVPAITVTFTDPDGAQSTAASAAIPLSIESVIPPGTDATEVRDLKPQLDLPFSPGVSRRAITGAIAFVVGLTLVASGGGWWLVRRQMRAAPALPVITPTAGTPEAVARAELDRIATLGLLDAGDTKAYHSMLASCVRRYLSERYRFPAFAMTTTELRAHMEERGVGRWQARLVTGLLSECDAVTYAQYHPARPRSDSNLSMAYEVIAMTAEGAEQINIVEVGT